MAMEAEKDSWIHGDEQGEASRGSGTRNGLAKG